MSLTDEQRADIVAYRIENAHEETRAIESLCREGLYRTAASRMYYAVYYIVTAWLIQHGIANSTHEGVYRNFGLYMVKPGVVTREENRLFKYLFDNRQTGDYSDNYRIQSDDALPYIEPMRAFIAKVESLIKAH